MNKLTTISQQPKLLWFLITTYVSVILLANWFDIRIIKILGLAIDAGTLIFPFTFLCSNLITEVYGYKFARRAIWVGFLFNFIFIGYGQLIIHLPSPDYALATNTNFDNLLNFNIRVIMASVCAYLFSEPLNSYIMAKLKILTNGKNMSMRFVLSTTIASFFDSFCFGFMAFAGIMPKLDLIYFNLTLWLIKVVVEIIGLPFSIYCANALKFHEKLDMYDMGTNFTLFSLESNYDSRNNHYNNLEE